MKFHVTICLVILVLAVFLAGMLLGPVNISPVNAIKAVLGEENELVKLVLIEIRLPRVILSLAIGASLGLSGAALQGLLQNPLAEPALLGAGPAAAFGAVLAFYFGWSDLTAFILPLSGIGAALFATTLVWALAGGRGKPETIILAGVAISSIAGSLTACALNFAPNPFAATEIIFWMMGSLADRSIEHVLLSLPFMIVGWMLLFSVRGPLDALALGAETASSLGVDMKSVSFRVIFGTAIAVGAATAVAGVVGFVGLAVPHILRPFVGHRPGALLIASALGGAVMLGIADVVVRMVSVGSELKLGVLTSIIGFPLFLALILKLRSS
jgi:iron complex transport system permease protein